MNSELRCKNAPVIRYTSERIPDDRPGAGEVTSDDFGNVWTRLVDVCERHDPDGNGIFVVEDQYNDYERYQYIEILAPELCSLSFFADLMDMLREHPYWGVGVGLPSGYILVFEDRLLVTGDWFVGCRCVDDVLSVARAATAVMHAADNVKNDDDLDALLMMPHATRFAVSMRLADTNVTDAGMRLVSQLAQLTSLDLTSTQVGDEGLSLLTSLTNLKTLVLNRTGVTDAGLRPIRQLRNLSRLHLSELRLGGSGLQYLESLLRMETLVLSWNSITDQWLRHLAGLRHLGSLRLDGNPITGIGLRYLSCHETLERITLRATDLDDEGLATLRGMTRLSRLDLDYTLVTSEGLRKLVEMPELHKISAQGTNAVDLPAEELVHRLPALSPGSCKVWKMPFSNQRNAAVYLLRKRTDIRVQWERCGGELRLTTCCHIKDGWRGSASDMRLMSLLPHLIVLSLENASIDDEYFRCLPTIASLHTVWVKSCNVTCASLANLKRQTGLDKLVICDSDIDDRAIEYIVSISPGELRLVDTKISADGIEQLRHRLTNCRIAEREWDRV